MIEYGLIWHLNIGRKVSSTQDELLIAAGSMLKNLLGLELVELDRPDNAAALDTVQLAKKQMGMAEELKKQAEVGNGVMVIFDLIECKFCQRKKLVLRVVILL